MIYFLIIISQLNLVRDVAGLDLRKSCTVIQTFPRLQSTIAATAATWNWDKQNKFLESIRSAMSQLGSLVLNFDS